MAWNKNATAGPTFSGAKLDPMGAAALDKAEREAGRGSTTRPTVQTRSPGMAQHVAGALAATKKQAPPGW